MEESLKIFENGSNWLKADFHLHTNADNEFTYSGEENSYINNYVNKLEEHNIRVAVISNHNKFDKDEYKAIRKKAKKKEIFILPGVELSVNDGANGIHSLVVFNPDEWLQNDTDFINQFLTQTFAGKANYENANGRSNDNLIGTIKKLDAFNKDYFIIMAHIEQCSGFYEGLDGGRIKEIGNHPLFKKSVLGFQKVRTRDYIQNLNTWFNNVLPAFVEGSDPKNIDEIGKGNQCFLKIGAYNFEAVKYALLDMQYRLSKKISTVTNGYIKDITFKGQKYEGTVHLNHSMNNLIGIRGSGKSSILEVIRYALDIELTEKDNEDYKYKNGIVNAILGSGGKIISTLVDDHGKQFRSEKTLGDINSKIYDETNELQIGLKPTAIVNKPIYFGQKDLSKIGDSLTTENLISKLVGDKLLNKRREIDEKNQQIIRFLDEIKKIESKIARKPEYEAKLAEINHKIQIFKDEEIDKKLEKQINFNKDANFIKRVESFEAKLIDALDELINEYNDGFESFKHYTSKENNSEVESTKQSLAEYERIFDTLRDVLLKLIDKHKKLSLIDEKFKVRYEELKEEFAKIKREINLPNIQADDYVKLTKDFDITKAQLSELEKMAKKRIDLHNQLIKELAELQNLWYNEHEIIKDEIKLVNDSQQMVNIDGRELKAIEIKVGYRENKDAFITYLKDNFRGTNISGDKFKAIAEKYPDLISIYSDFNNKENKIKKILTEGQYFTFKEYFNNNIGAYLTYRTPDKFEIIYRGRPLSEHSLGQRASALIIFLLTLKDSDLIIIDQPEDDLDNQTIYNDVIKVLKDLKDSSQFVFATHNPNIPVLGDCEQLIVCNYDSNSIKTNMGSIDDEIIRQKIVKIMEGGEEAFNNRKRIYELWMH